MRSFFIVFLFVLKSNAIEVHGHRGARAAFPENTMPAFEHAIEAGADYMEIDIVVTKDGHLVVHHDLTVNKDNCLHANGDDITEQLPIYTLTLAEVKSFDCGSLVNSEFPNQTPVPGAQIPTLAEVFGLMRTADEYFVGDPIKLNIEIKSDKKKLDWTPSYEEYAALVANAVENSDLTDRIQVQAFDETHLEKLIPYELGVRTAFLSTFGFRKAIQKRAAAVGGKCNCAL